MDIQIVPDHQDGPAELEVGPHEKVSVVLPGEPAVVASVCPRSNFSGRLCRHNSFAFGLGRTKIRPPKSRTR
ncbi:hypothetical protein J7E87_25840 [Streptomyces sp. ISL-1]|uniref:hypothetical protein n=1 Tax=Streptomyces sp. ISL-1 TaxID=2817657 RepID=UPI001BE5F78C|nr:hypothetical protein [Streptomyces sp. ISL-1]MBT2392761.1 hypothetical protein [Streptomyces sp. ISL-1]